MFASHEGGDVPITDELATPTDPVLAEILLGACTHIVEETDDILERASMGMVIRESRDYCSVIADAGGGIIATGRRDLPAFVGTIQDTIHGVIEWIGEEAFEPGDVYIVNCPWVGGTHYNDVRLVAPVHQGDRLIGYVGSCGHIGDVGGMNPGSIAVRAQNAFAEGLRIVPVLFSRHGAINQDVWKLIMANIRIQDVAEGDLRAMHSAVERGHLRLRELADLHGPAVLADWMAGYQEFGRRAVREQVSALDDGRYEFTDWIDEDPLTGEPLRVELAVEVKGERLRFDFAGSSLQAKGASNNSLSSTKAIVYVVTKYVFPELPLNYGTMGEIEIEAPLGTVVNAEFPAPVSAMAASTFDIVAACVFGAFAQVVPDRAMAASYNLQSLILGGHDPRWDRDFVSYSWGPGGWGATRDLDGRVGMPSTPRRPRTSPVRPRSDVCRFSSRNGRSCQTRADRAEGVVATACAESFVSTPTRSPRRWRVGGSSRSGDCSVAKPASHNALNWSRRMAARTWAYWSTTYAWQPGIV